MAPGFPHGGPFEDMWCIHAYIHAGPYGQRPCGLVRVVPGNP